MDKLAYDMNFTDTKLSAASPCRSKKDITLFASTNPNRVDPALLGNVMDFGDANGFRIPALINTGKALVAAVDTGNDGSDWGDINVAVRRSLDNGKTWSSPMQIVLNSPTRLAALQADAHASSFYIDPVLVQAQNGDIVMLVDFWPECHGLFWKERNQLEGSLPVQLTVNGSSYMALYPGISSLDGAADPGLPYTVRENGWVYTPEGKKTNYYLPQNHDGVYGYQTIGDMYFAVGEPDYLTRTPPLIPPEPADGQDVYVGNIYLSKDKPEFSMTSPVFVQKLQVGDTKKTGKSYDAYGDYEAVQTKAAPLRVPLRCYLFVTRSTDDGATWSQPVDITASVLEKGDSIFLGTAPGVGIRLEHQQDSVKNGRLMMPVYHVGPSIFINEAGRAAVIYSDDGGYHWKRAKGYINNAGEWQLIEQADGTLMSFGRQLVQDITPVSYSFDGGETWGRRKYTALQSVKCQKSILTYPMGSAFLPEGLDPDRQYVLASHPTGSTRKKSGRCNGAVSLGVIEADHTITWLYQRSLVLDGQFSGLKQPENENYFAYSCMAVLSNGEIGVFYESQPVNHLSYGIFNLKWVMEGGWPKERPGSLGTYLWRVFSDLIS